jgi:hypothetical protein
LPKSFFVIKKKKKKKVIITYHSTRINQDKRKFACILENSMYQNTGFIASLMTEPASFEKEGYSTGQV